MAEDVDEMIDDRLVARFRASTGHEKRMCFDQLLRGRYPQIARWCLRVCAGPQQALELAREIVVEAHSHSEPLYRGDGFSGWLYSVSRRVALRHGIGTAERRHDAPRSQSVP